MAADVELAEVRAFLASHAPFEDLPADVLDGLPGRLAIRYFRRGSRILALGASNDSLYVIRSGAADIRDAHGVLVDRAGEGGSLGSITLVLGGPSTFEATAIEDTLTLVMEAATFRELSAGHAEFARFYDAQRANRMRGAVALQQASANGGAVLKTAVSDMVRRPPVTAESTVPIRDAARAMAEGGASSLLVLDGQRIAGIVTDRDLRTRVLAADLDPGRPVADIMTPDPVTRSHSSLAFEVLLEMTGRNIHHVPIVRDGVPIGVITTTDLVRLEQANPVFVVGDVVKQTDVAGVAAVCRRLPDVVSGLVAQDASAEDIGRVVTAIGDAVERRLLTLAEAELGPPPVPYCWVTLGSRARREQALAADQDNALILDDAVQPEHGPYFAALAERVCDALVECGYPRCPGEIMATTPRWRQPVSRWRSEFRSWLTEPVPEALLQASIFFDARPVHGDAGLYAALSAYVLANAPASRVFLAHMAKQAAANEPPLGFFRGFVLEKEGAHRDSLDVKRGGLRAVVELARVHALSLGSPAVDTNARIAAAVAEGLLSPERGEDLRDAFEFIAYVRLRHQAAQVRAGAQPDNYVRPDDLSSFDKRHLREAFAIVRSAQTAMAHRYPLQYIS
jgi:CBS domain-containing protein